VKKPREPDPRENQRRRDRTSARASWNHDFRRTMAGAVNAAAMAKTIAENWCVWKRSASASPRSRKSLHRPRRTTRSRHQAAKTVINSVAE